MTDLIPRDPTEVASPADFSPMALIERAITAGSGIEILERLMDMQERADARRARRCFDAAIAEARSNIKPIIKTATVDYSSAKGRTHYQHETLDAIATQIDSVLADHGLSYRFRSAQAPNLVTVTCIIAHREGYSEETSLSGPPDQSGSKNPYQAIGSAVTYLQRYTLKLALGLSAAKDDDATGANQAPQRPPQRQAPQQGGGSKEIAEAITHLGLADSLPELMHRWRQIGEHLHGVQAVKDAAGARRKQIEEAPPEPSLVDGIDLGAGK